MPYTIIKWRGGRGALLKPWAYYMKNGSSSTLTVLAYRLLKKATPTTFLPKQCMVVRKRRNIPHVSILWKGVRVYFGTMTTIIQAPSHNPNLAVALAAPLCRYQTAVMLVSCQRSLPHFVD
jgi:hypothetical protein